MVPPPTQTVPGVEKIAVLRANGIGDFIFTLPALAALRAAYPAAEITLLALPWHASFLAGRPGPVDRVIVIPPSPGVGAGLDFVGDPAGMESFFTAMRRERFDLALQLHGGGRYSNPFVLRLGARLTAGLKTPDAIPLDRWVPYVYFQPEIVRMLEVVALVGAPAGPLEPSLAVTAEDRAEAERVVPEAPLPLVALHPGAGDPRRRWPVEKFAAVGDALAAAGAHVVVTGSGPEERPLVAAVVETMRSEARDLSDCLSLGGLAGLLSRCRVVVSNDSGPLHLATAVGAPTVGIFWFLNLITAGTLTRSRHRPFIAPCPYCPICGADCVHALCDHLVSLVAEVSVDDVAGAALELLTAPSPSPSATWTPTRA